MTLNTLKNLELLGNATPLPDSVRTYLEDNIAQGGGPNGTYLLTDFFGTAAGLPANQVLTDAAEFINTNLANGDANFATLNTIYFRLYEVVTGAYDQGGGEGEPSVVIPPGPGAGVYSNRDRAAEALLALADATVGLIVSAKETDAANLNTGWVAMAKGTANEPVNHGKAGIDWPNIPSNLELPVTVFINSLSSYGQDTAQGGARQVLEALADTSIQAGQALIGVLREGENDQTLDQENIGHDNVIPEAPVQPPPQASLSDASYTPAEARVSIQRRLGGFFS